jgi:GNAT superfamily N-acetyltransferase
MAARRAEDPGPVPLARPLTLANFADLEAVFGAKGCSFARGCWCMAYRISGRPRPPEGMTAAAFQREGLRALAASGPPPGLIGYDAAGAPAGWVAVGPREDFARLRRSPVMGPVDDRPAWAVVCFVVPGPLRGRGVARALLGHAVRHARAQGARIVEGFPVDKPGRSPDGWLWHGTKGLFAGAGFAEVARRKPTRPVMRLEIGAGGA